MRKISLFMLMIFGMFMLFAQETAPQEAKNETNEAVKAEAPAETQPAEAPAQPETAQPAEAPAQAETAQPAEAPAQEEQKPAEQETPAETSPETSQGPAETVQGPAETLPETPKKPGKPQKVRYYRPYAGIGIPLIVIGSISFIALMPAMGTVAFAASDACEGKDWGFCEELHENNKKHHTAWTVGAVMTGVLGAGMVVTGSWLTSVRKPDENQKIELQSVSLLPTDKGMYASIGFKF